MAAREPRQCHRLLTIILDRLLIVDLSGLRDGRNYVRIARRENAAGVPHVPSPTGSADRYLHRVLGPTRWRPRAHRARRRHPRLPDPGRYAQAKLRTPHREAAESNSAAWTLADGAR